MITFKQYITEEKKKKKKKKTGRRSFGFGANYKYVSGMYGGSTPGMGGDGDTGVTSGGGGEGGGGGGE